MDDNIKENTPEGGIESTSNIFDDFASDESLLQDVSKLEKRVEKNLSYYIGMIIGFLKILNSIIVFVLIFLFGYIFVQKSTSPLGLSFLNPFCSAFIGDVKYEEFSSQCEGVLVVKNMYNGAISKLVKKQYSEIESLVADVYSMESFIFSKEVKFLVDKSDNRLKPLEIINKFESVKIQYDEVERSRIQCSNVKISEGNLLHVSCEAYSADWENQILGFNSGENDAKISGSSITVANSFLYFIEKKAPEFVILERQKSFSSVPAGSQSYFTKKTQFDLVLRYSPDNL